MEILHIFGWITTISTVSLQLIGIEICVQIVRKGSTGDISPVPFVTYFVSACIWLRYGVLQMVISLIIVNLCGAFLQFLYILLFYIYTVRKTQMLKFLFFGGMILFTPLVYIKYFLEDTGTAARVLGSIGFCTTVLSYAAPLASLTHVMQTRSTECMSFPLVFSNFILAVEWFVYGVLLNDQFVQLPNAIGVSLGLVQLALFVKYPSKVQSLPVST